MAMTSVKINEDKIPQAVDTVKLNQQLFGAFNRKNAQNIAEGELQFYAEQVVGLTKFLNQKQAIENYYNLEFILNLFGLLQRFRTSCTKLEQAEAKYLVEQVLQALAENQAAWQAFVSFEQLRFKQPKLFRPIQSEACISPTVKFSQSAKQTPHDTLKLLNWQHSVHASPGLQRLYLKNLSQAKLTSSPKHDYALVFSEMALQALEKRTRWFTSQPDFTQITKLLLNHQANSSFNLQAATKILNSNLTRNEKVDLAKKSPSLALHMLENQGWKTWLKSRFWFSRSVYLNPSELLQFAKSHANNLEVILALMEHLPKLSDKLEIIKSSKLSYSALMRVHRAYPDNIEILATVLDHWNVAKEDAMQLLQDYERDDPKTLQRLREVNCERLKEYDKVTADTRVEIEKLKRSFEDTKQKIEQAIQNIAKLLSVRNPLPKEEAVKMCMLDADNGQEFNQKQVDLRKNQWLVDQYKLLFDAYISKSDFTNLIEEKFIFRFFEQLPLEYQIKFSLKKPGIGWIYLIDKLVAKSPTTLAVKNEEVEVTAGEKQVMKNNYTCTLTQEAVEANKESLVQLVAVLLRDTQITSDDKSKLHALTTRLDICSTTLVNLSLSNSQNQTVKSRSGSEIATSSTDLSDDDSCLSSSEPESPGLSEDYFSSQEMDTVSHSSNSSTEPAAESKPTEYSI